MNTLLIETDLAFDEATLEDLLNALPPTWRTRAERYKPFDVRLRSAVGYTMLARVLRETYDITDLPSVEADEHGKPYLTGLPLYFSISHCKAAVACIVDKRPVGLDVQDILTDISPALAARIAAPLSPDGLTPYDLTVLWAQKEASAKCDGRGLKIGLENLPLEGHEVKTEEGESYILCYAK